MLHFVLHGGAQHGGVKRALVEPFERHRGPVARIFAPIRQVERLHLLLRYPTPISNLSHEIRQAFRSRSHLTPKRNVVKLDYDIPFDFPVFRPRPNALRLFWFDFFTVFARSHFFRRRRRRHLLVARLHDILEQRRPPIRQPRRAKLAHHLFGFPRALQLPSRHAFRVRPSRARTRVVELRIAKGHTVQSVSQSSRAHFSPHSKKNAAKSTRNQWDIFDFPTWRMPFSKHPFFLKKFKHGSLYVFES